MPQIQPNAALRLLEAWGANRRWIGPDPYEGLNSAIGGIAPGKRSRQTVMQVYKRSPLSSPWPLAAASQPNSKALALALSGYATPAGRRLPNADEFLVELPRCLERLNLAPQGAEWGYHFDVETRRIAYDKSTPNAIATCFVVGSLLDARTATGEERHARLALAARPFLASLLTHGAHGPFFAYVAAGSELIHNANLLVCGALARLHEVEPDERVRGVVEDAVATTLALQREDGLWRYGESSGYDWIDNFHTAYTLDGLAQVRRAFGVGAEALERGLRGWRARFIEPDGWARYYPDRHLPLDAHCCASAIDLLCSDAIWTPDHGSAAELIARTAIRELWLDEPGRFAFRRTRLRLNKREFMRWTNAPMFRALARMSR